MHLLAIDIGTGTQDILLWQSDTAVENLTHMVLPSPTVRIDRAVRALTRARQPILLTGVTMGGGPSAWAIRDHALAGLPVYALPDAARTLDDDLDRVRAEGLTIVADASEAPRDAVHVALHDLDLQAIMIVFKAFGIDAPLDGLLVAAFDHGAAPPHVSDRAFRFAYLAETIGLSGDLATLSYLRADLPASLTRLAAIVSGVPEDLPLLLLDTGAAAALGALDDPRVRAAHHPLLVNVGNFHTLAFQMAPSDQDTVSVEGPAGEVVGLFEHHTGEVTGAQLDDLLLRLSAGTLTNAEVFNTQGHGALLRDTTPRTPDLCAVTGPRRRLMARSVWQPYYAVPHGDMMLAGCFGLLRAAAHRIPNWREEIDRSLAVRDVSP